MFCTKCGNSLNEAQKFCDGCGALVAKETPTVQAESKAKANDSSEQGSTDGSKVNSALSKLDGQVSSLEGRIETISSRLNTLEKKMESSSKPGQIQKTAVVKPSGDEEKEVNPKTTKKRSPWIRAMVTVLIIIVVILVIWIVVYVFREPVLDQLEDWGLRTDWIRRELNIY